MTNQAPRHEGWSARVLVQRPRTEACGFPGFKRSATRIASRAIPIRDAARPRPPRITQHLGGLAMRMRTPSCAARVTALAVAAPATAAPVNSPCAQLDTFSCAGGIELDVVTI